MLSRRGLGVSEAKRDWESMAITVTFGKAFGAAGALLLFGRRRVFVLAAAGAAACMTAAFCATVLVPLA